MKRSATGPARRAHHRLECQARFARMASERKYWPLRLNSPGSRIAEYRSRPFPEYTKSPIRCWHCWWNSKRSRWRHRIPYRRRLLFPEYWRESAPPIPWTPGAAPLPLAAGRAYVTRARHPGDSLRVGLLGDGLQHGGVGLLESAVAHRDHFGDVLIYGILGRRVDASGVHVDDRGVPRHRA